MSILKPTYRFHKITDVSMDLLKSLDVKSVLLDVDNTLCSYKSKTPLDGAIDWVRDAEQNGYKVYIVSNNYKKRVSNVAKKYSLPFVSMALKPLPKGFNKAAKVLNLNKKDCVIIGDQIFTDILGGNLARMKSILVEPIELENKISVKIRRYFEKFVKKNLEFYKEA